MKKLYKQYFDISFFDDIGEQPKDLDSILSDTNYIISGDFYGIQKFIFDHISTKNASKVLRAKSAFIQVYTKYLAKYICTQIGIDEKYILSLNAGKFEILSPKDVDLEPIRKKINEFFIKNYYALGGVGVCKVACVREDFKDSKRYKALRKKIADEIELLKFKKFDLQKQNPILEYDKQISNQTLCPICNIRKIEDSKDSCRICNDFIELGKKLTFKEQTDYQVNYFEEFKTSIKLDKKLKSYVLKKENNSPATFEELAKSSCKNLDSGIKAIGVLKADVDSMGDFLKNNDITDSFENFDTFSKVLDNFFSLYIPQKLMRDRFRYTYTVFAGGDDLFLVGSWDEILDLARQIRKDFKKFVKNSLSISFGIAIAKPSTPISYLANHTEELLERSKEFNGKDAITIFNETVKWDSYLKVYDKLDETFKKFNQNSLNTTFLYRLLDFCEMSKEAKEGKIRATIWKSKLNYIFNRNIDEKYHYLIVDLDEVIESTPKETKMFLSEFIYKRRDG